MRLPVPVSQSTPGIVPHAAFEPGVVARIVRESRLAQGLPERITDPVVIARLAVLVASAEAGKAGTGPEALSWQVTAVGRPQRDC